MSCHPINSLIRLLNFLYLYSLSSTWRNVVISAWGLGWNSAFSTSGTRHVKVDCMKIFRGEAGIIT